MVRKLLLLRIKNRRVPYDLSSEKMILNHQINKLTGALILVKGKLI